MRLIDADELTLDTDAYCTDASGCYKSIADAPTIDAVSVVRCKECKHKDKIVNYCYVNERIVNPDDFCSYGERSSE